MLATGPFEVSLIPTAPDDHSGDAILGRFTLDKRFSGDLVGTSKGQMLAIRTAVNGSAGYVAMERVTGTLNGRAGTFALQHNGTMNRGVPALLITVVPDSGTGALEGLSGSMNIIIAGKAHSYEFTHELPTTG